MIFYQIHVFLRCFIRSSKTSVFTVIPSTWRKPYNLGFLGSSGRCWASWAAWAPWAFLGHPGQFLGDPSYRIRVFLCLGDYFACVFTRFPFPGDYFACVFTRFPFPGNYFACVFTRFPFPGDMRMYAVSFPWGHASTHAYLPCSGALRKTSIITLYSINSDLNSNKSIEYYRVFVV